MSKYESDRKSQKICAECLSFKIVWKKAYVCIEMLDVKCIFRGDMGWVH